MGAGPVAGCRPGGDPREAGQHDGEQGLEQQLERELADARVARPLDAAEAGA